MKEIQKKHLNTIKDILLQHVPQCEVRAFGSRIEGNAKSYSDLDLAIVGKGKVESRKLMLLKEAFENSDLPYRVDVLDWHRITDSFRKIIEKRYKVIQEPL